MVLGGIPVPTGGVQLQPGVPRCGQAGGGCPAGGAFPSIGALRKGLGREGRCPQDGALREGLWLFLLVSPSGDWDWGRGFLGMGVLGWVGLLGEGSGSMARLFLLAGGGLAGVGGVLGWALGWVGFLGGRIPGCGCDTFLRSF